eukprot:SAG11_NODE_6671_length_1270_cov_1.459436_2_plen_73_part_00
MRGEVASSHEHRTGSIKKLLDGSLWWRDVELSEELRDLLASGVCWEKTFRVVQVLIDRLVVACSDAPNNTKD